MDRETIYRWIEENSEESFVRSSGPGGQHVNKTSTATLCRIDLNRLQGVDEVERRRLKEKLKNRVNASGELIVRAGDNRSQLRNRENALRRAFELLIGALHQDAPRRPTKPTKASRLARLQGKKLRSRLKEGRRRPPPDT